MNARELIAFLDTLPPETLVLWRDTDGRRHLRLGPVDNGRVVAVTRRERGHDQVTYSQTGGSIPAVLFDYLHTDVEDDHAREATP